MARFWFSNPVLSELDSEHPGWRQDFEACGHVEVLPGYPADYGVTVNLDWPNQDPPVIRLLDFIAILGRAMYHPPQIEPDTYGVF